MKLHEIVKKAQAKPKLIDKLKEVKSLSDEKKYKAKADKLLKLIKEQPGKFVVDSEDGGIVGITHSPTGFQFHLPRNVISGMSLERTGEEKEAQSLSEAGALIKGYWDKLSDEAKAKIKAALIGGGIGAVGGGLLEGVPGAGIGGAVGAGAGLGYDALKNYIVDEFIDDQDEEDQESEDGTLERIKKSQARMPDKLVSRWCLGFTKTCCAAGVDPSDLIKSSGLKTLPFVVD